jgi:hypothetical protein
MVAQKGALQEVCVGTRRHPPTIGPLRYDERTKAKKTKRNLTQKEISEVVKPEINPKSSVVKWGSRKKN